MNALTKWFEDQVGIQEQGENNVIYNTIYYGGEVSGSQFPWCCAFIWVGFNQNNMSDLFCGGVKTAYCPYVVNYAKTHNQWVEGGYREGDLILFDWSGNGEAQHIGYCAGVNGNTVITIEGNCNDRVSKCYRDTSIIMGAYRPNYPLLPSIGVDNNTKQQEEEVSPLYTVKAGDSLWSIAERHYGSGLRWQEIYNKNNLKSTTILIGQKLKL